MSACRLGAVACIGGLVALFGGPANAQHSDLQPGAEKVVQTPKQLNPWVDALVRDELDLSDYTVQDLDLPEVGSETIKVTVMIGKQPVEIALAKESMRSRDFVLYVQGDDGILRETPPPPVRTYKSTNDLLAIGMLRESGLRVGLWMDNGSVWCVHPLAEIDPNADAGLHVVFRDADIVHQDVSCGFEDHGDEPIVEQDGTGATLRGGTNSFLTDIGLDTDFEFYQLAGGTINSAAEELEWIIEGVEVVYERDVDISYEISTMVIRTAEPDPFSVTDASSLLNQVQDEWTVEPLQSARRDTAHLMTGKNISGNTIGIANLGGICSSTFGVGLSQTFFSGNSLSRWELTAHELGHNWSAQHCDAAGSDCRIMCSSINSCFSGLLFGNSSISTITNYRNTRSCLDSLAPPQSIPFVDNFSSLNSARWVYNKGAIISSQGLNEPSPTNSLQLSRSSGSTTNPYIADEIRSNEILLGSSVSPTVSYFVEPRGGEPDDMLIVEVFTSDSLWEQVNAIAGANDNQYTQYQHTLSGNQIHNAFRIRFRTEVDSPNDLFYIDDIVISADPAGACCILASQRCELISESNCSAVGGLYQGDGTVCSPDPCPEPMGACCIIGTGLCTETTPTDCTAQGGTFEGAFTTCATTTCPQPVGACCMGDGTCVDITEEDCALNGGAYEGDGLLCSTEPCPTPTGACCLTDGSCIDLVEVICQISGGTFSGNGTVCTVGLCGTTPTGACCFADGSCLVQTESDCISANGSYNGNDTICSPNPCPQPTGACCMSDGSCVELTEVDCQGLSGTYQGNGATCAAATCPLPTGACCLADGSCTSVTSADCATANGVYQGDSSDCLVVSCPTSCPCDIDGSTVVDSTDFFDFLDAFFVGSIGADFDNSGIVDSSDFFGFLDCFFAPGASGC